MDRRTRGIIAAAFVAQGLAIGSTIGAFGLFVRPVADTFSATTLQVSAGISLITLTLGICGAPIGIWLDRGSPRRIMFTGSTLLAFGLLLASQAGSLFQLALTCVLCGSSVPMLGPLTTAAVVSKAVDEERGRALGIANLGIPIGALSFAIVAGIVIDAADWRAALQIFSAIVLVFGVTSVAIGIPKDFGGHAETTDVERDPRNTWTPARLFRTPVFVLITVALGISMGTNAGWVAHTASYLIDLGTETRNAGILLGATQGSMVIGTLAFGYLVDRRGSIPILAMILLTQIVCFGVMLGGPTIAVVSTCLLVYGISAGGFFPAFTHLLAERFGADNVGRVMGLTNLGLLPFGFGLPMIGGALRDSSGSYASTMVLCSFLLLTGVGVLFALYRLPGGELSPGDAEPTR